MQSQPTEVYPAPMKHDKLIWLMVFALLTLVLTNLQGQAVVINEVMYHPPMARDDLQFIELMNIKEEVVDLSGWRLSGGVNFTFPKGAQIQPNSFTVISASPLAFSKHYQTQALGPFKKSLSHSGERIALMNDAGQVIDELTFSDESPWPKTPDGYGASIERIAPSIPVTTHRNWAPSKLPPQTIARGTPGKRNLHFQQILPPEVTEATRIPETPRPGQPIRIEATINDDHGVKNATIAYQTVTESGVSAEQYVPMKLSGGSEISGRFQGDLGSFSNGTLVRFQIRVTNLEGGQTSWPHPQSLKPALSFFVTDYRPQGLIPHTLVLNPSGIERAKRKYDIKASALAPEPTRGNSAFIFFPTGSSMPQVRDFIRVGRRTGGYKIRFRTQEPFQEMTTLNLLDEGKPRFALSEFLSYELFRMTGVPAPYADHYRLRMDQEWKGYHLVVEQPNKAFLRRNNRNDKGNLYKLLWYGRNFIQQHEKKTNLGSGHNDIIQTVQALGRLNGDPEWRYIRQHFNVEEFATFYAVNQCISNWDGYFNNYFIYHDTGNTGKWEIYPWDTDKTWGDFDGASATYDWYSMPLTFGAEGDRPGGSFFHVRRGPFGGQSWWRPPGHLSGPLLANPGFRQVFLKKLSELLNTTFTEEKFLPVINALEDRLGPEVAFKYGGRSSWATDRLRKDVESLRNQVRNRRKYLLENL
jgi:hypothetical protein